MKIIDHKEFAKAAILSAAEWLGLNDWELMFAWSEGRDEKVANGAACMRYADYQRFHYSIEVFDWFVKENENDPDYVAQIMLHEVLHVFTIAPLKVFEEDKSMKEFLGTASFNYTLNEMSIYNEQMNVRLEHALYPEFKKSSQYAELFALPCLSQDAPA